MNGIEYNEFLKSRRTYKYFDSDFLIPEEHKLLLIDASNNAPAQNCNKSFIPILVEDKKTKEWLIKNVFYMVEKETTNTKIPKEYQMGIVTAPLVFVYLEANKPIVSTVGSDGEVLKEPENGDTAIKILNMGMNMAFVANQAYMLGYDVGFVGCSRGVNTVVNDDTLRQELHNIYAEYGLLQLGKKFGLAPTKAVCIGKALPFDTSPRAVEGYPFLDGIYTNRKKHSLNPIEYVRTKVFPNE